MKKAILIMLTIGGLFLLRPQREQKMLTKENADLVDQNAKLLMNGNAFVMAPSALVH
jgi:hypothetical protein